MVTTSESGQRDVWCDRCGQIHEANVDPADFVDPAAVHLCRKCDDEEERRDAERLDHEEGYEVDDWAMERLGLGIHDPMGEDE